MRLELLVIAFSVVVGPVAALLGAGATGAGPWVIVVPPWKDAELLAERAQARLIGPVAAPMGHLVAPLNGQTAATGAVTRLAAAGAWAVVDAETILELCGVE
ncbi:hypothetical protein C8J27_10280 [Rhodobacter aestuarii]|uniref:Uncharacterized protein n=1 Tax=Rhodobacter aestuarii TaxID=453582 RepID=A0A1N7N7Q3_9RHOB|nr:hypothetical protein [Rhodobacter aestuarii]PTV96286.1 hypothetical protein C8J27_10280 [Rhodobacter aestuarii]SIS94393.1 hypothetical protein SAMN05421580_10780 [Rhodobacter aestuarii]